MNSNKAVFLDRDGVLNKPIFANGRSYAPKYYSDFIIYPNVNRALALLKEAEFNIFVITNQPDIGNQSSSIKEVEKMHHFLFENYPILSIKMCPHKQSENCMCRKPNTKLVEECFDEYDLDREGCWFVGDRPSDIFCGHNSGLNTVLIDRNYAEYSLFDTMKINPDFKASDILGATLIIIQSLNP